MEVRSQSRHRGWKIVEKGRVTKDREVGKVIEGLDCTSCPLFTSGSRGRYSAGSNGCTTPKRQHGRQQRQRTYQTERREIKTRIKPEALKLLTVIPRPFPPANINQKNTRTKDESCSKRELAF
ncbi:hypothetical protein CBL_01135 [Carabus blaptoides fortunei]